MIHNNWTNWSVKQLKRSDKGLLSCPHCNQAWEVGWASVRRNKSYYTRKHLNENPLCQSAQSSQYPSTTPAESSSISKQRKLDPLIELTEKLQQARKSADEQKWAALTDPSRTEEFPEVHAGCKEQLAVAHAQITTLRSFKDDHVAVSEENTRLLGRNDSLSSRVGDLERQKTEQHDRISKLEASLEEMKRELRGVQSWQRDVSAMIIDKPVPSRVTVSDVRCAINAKMDSAQRHADRKAWVKVGQFVRNIFQSRNMNTSLVPDDMNETLLNSLIGHIITHETSTPNRWIEETSRNVKELFRKFPTMTKTIFRKIQAPIAADKFPNASNEEKQVRSCVTQMLQEAIVAFGKIEP